jgi:hypothetical protein
MPLRAALGQCFTCYNGKGKNGFTDEAMQPSSKAKILSDLGPDPTANLKDSESVF